MKAAIDEVTVELNNKEHLLHEITSKLKEVSLQETLSKDRLVIL